MRISDWSSDVCSSDLLADTSGALRPALLHQRIGGEKARLDAVRLRTELLQRRLTDSRVALDRLARPAASLDPDRPLSRGLARVMDGDRLVSSAAAAKAAGPVTLTVKDGEEEAELYEGMMKSAATGP